MKKTENRKHSNELKR